MTSVAGIWPIGPLSSWRGSRNLCRSVGALLTVLFRAASLGFAVLLVLAILHKAQLALRGGGSLHPVLAATPWRAAHARSLLAVAATVESNCCALLLRQPELGFALLGALVSGYAFALRKLSPNASCNCFGAVLEARSARTAIRRNLAIGVTSLSGALAYASGRLQGSRIPPESISVALVLIAAIVGYEASRLWKANLTRSKGAHHGYQ